jgi:hypothetical protein
MSNDWPVESFIQAAKMFLCKCMQVYVESLACLLYKLGYPHYRVPRFIKQYVWRFELNNMTLESVFSLEHGY